MPEYCDKGGLLPLPVSSVWLSICVRASHHRDPQRAVTGLKQTMFLLRRRKTLSKDAHPPWRHPSTAESAVRS